MEDKISLAQAFKVRKIVKNAISQTYIKYLNIEKVWEKGKRPEFLLNESPEELINLFDFYSTIEKMLSIRIDKVNKEVASEVLINLNDISNRINHYKTFINDAKEKRAPTKEINPVSGIETITEYETFGDVLHYQSMLKQYSKTKFSLEETLSKINATSYIDIGDIKEDIEKILDYAA
jgi:uncharacterized protein Yka (UPF0111/DUF47 family)